MPVTVAEIYAFQCTYGMFYKMSKSTQALCLLRTTSAQLVEAVTERHQ